jgi:predicted MFS family arabinose efflux permease
MVQPMHSQTGGPIADPEEASRGPVRLLQAAALVSTLDRVAIAPLIVPIAADLSLSVDQVTLAATAYLLTYGVMQLVWAAASDRFGRVRMMRVALTVAGLAGVASALAPNLALLVAARALAGAAFAAAVPGALVYIGDTVPIRIRPSALADLVTGIATGFAIGTLGAAVISEQLNWRIAFVITGAAAFLLSVLIGRLPEPRRAPSPGMLTQIPRLVRHPGTLLVLALAFLEGAIVLGLLVLLPATLQLSGVSTANAGAVTAAYGVAVILAAWWVKRTASRAVPHRVLAVGGVFAIAAFGLLTVAHGPVPVMIAAACLGASWAQMHTALQAWATEVRPESRGLVVSAFAASLFMGSAVGTSIGGVLLAGGSVTLLFAGATSLAVVLTVVATSGRRRQLF